VGEEVHGEIFGGGLELIDALQHHQRVAILRVLLLEFLPEGDAHLQRGRLLETRTRLE